jgi:hypothetical protein
MTNKYKWYSIMLIGLISLLASLIVGCLGIERISPFEIYEDEIGSILKEYKSVIDDWGKAANDPSKLQHLDLDADIAYSRMENIIAAWDTVTPPETAKEYHLWMRHAMNYEKEAFGIMAEYYRLDLYSDRDEFTRLRDLATQLWILKDQALLKAEAAYPRD